MSSSQRSDKRRVATPAETTPGFERLYATVLTLSRTQAINAVGYQDADDIAQEMGMEVWSRWARDPHCFDDEAGLAAFVRVGVRRRVIERARQSQRLGVRQSAYEAARASAAPAWMNPGRAIEEEELADCVEAAVAAMPRQRRETFMGVRESESTYAEYATAHAMQPHAVAQNMSRAMQELRAAVTRYWKEGR